MEKQIMKVLWETTVIPMTESVGMAGFKTEHQTTFDKISQLVNVDEETFNQVVRMNISREEKANMLMNLI
jgi:hypothetical protein